MTQISLCIRAVWSESLQIVCAFFSLQAILSKTVKQVPLPHWVDVHYRLVFACNKGLIVGFVRLKLTILTKKKTKKKTLKTKENTHSFR